MVLMTPSYAPSLAFHLPRIDIRNLDGRHEDEDYVRLFIANQFECQQIGRVSRIDLVSKENIHGYLYYQAFVHFAEWFNTRQSVSLRNAACSPSKKATLQLLGSKHYWIVNESRSPVFEEDWQSLLSAVSRNAGAWVQAADEEELVKHQIARSLRTMTERWYKRVPTDEELAAVSAIERFAIKYRKPQRITCPMVCHLFAAQQQLEYEQALAAVAQAEQELLEAEARQE
jgi:hypothetical protein